MKSKVTKQDILALLPEHKYLSYLIDFDTLTTSEWVTLFINYDNALCNGKYHTLEDMQGNYFKRKCNFNNLNNEITFSDEKIKELNISTSKKQYGEELTQEEQEYITFYSNSSEIEKLILHDCTYGFYFDDLKKLVTKLVWINLMEKYPRLFLYKIYESI